MFTQRASLPGRRSSTSRSTTKGQLCAIGTTIVTTARDEELDLAGDTRITDWLGRVASKADTLVVSEVTTGDDRASAACPCEEGNSDRHNRSGASEESGSDEDDVELHFDWWVCWDNVASKKAKKEEWVEDYRTGGWRGGLERRARMLTWSKGWKRSWVKTSLEGLVFIRFLSRELPYD